MEIFLREIAQWINGEIVGDPEVLIKGINSLDRAGPEEISFYFDKRYIENLKDTKAGAIIVGKRNELFHGPQIVVHNPALAYAEVAHFFAPPVPTYTGPSGQAYIHKKCFIGKNVSVYPMAYVGEGAVIGDDVILFPGVFVGDRVRIGQGTVIYPHVAILQDCVIGDNVIIHGGTVIGSDGFGFVKKGSVSVKIPQIGKVQIDDHVELGANNTIDRAALGKTWIKRGVKTDNGVHIGHNVVIGEDTIVVAQAAISGSVHIGREVILGGQVAVSDHLKIGDKAMIGPQSGVAKSIAEGDVVAGTPTMPHRLWLKTSGLVRKLPQMNEHIRHLERRVKELEAYLDKEKAS